ncbi:MAG: hypothetical protein A3A33_00515 [Candidatus Yanofskybacteria bacterium RIFCSPLOWO2_01_FULL_49_25]|uniref:Doxx family protein n=1 Tax=Candidatus Yanofskybacteria bacterium RIFCSPLOWO2_01_FULL_49_25 TaxID=1802701 RepID=A0A1F8GQY1_9BACT|nr:MAG: hypothetical protein A3A33_00515 [Candidatus Yanofskybacteria bacterium RIFCSPLOWO2_01_FULL_49_25]
MITKQNFGRIALFVIYAWFGILKIVGQSPATPMITALMAKTVPSFISPHLFFILLGSFEALIGLMFMFPKIQKYTNILFVLHMLMVWTPLILTPTMVWSAWFVPTLEGQYIIKNLALIAIVLNLKREQSAIVAVQQQA